MIRKADKNQKSICLFYYLQKGENRYEYGAAGVKRDYAMASQAVDQLNETQRGIAYDTGKAVYDRRMARERQKFSQESKGAAITREGTVSLAGATVQGQKLAAVVWETTTRRQRDSVDIMRRLARVTGVDVVFYQSRDNEKGEYTAANGFYRDGTVYLDINAGKNRVGDMSQTAILLTASHELTHFIKEYNPAQYEQLRDFVVERLTEAEDVDLDALVQRHQKDQPELSYDEALDEVVADGCQMMLQDSQAAAALAKQNRSLAGNIRSWLRKWAKKLQEAFRGLTAQKPEAQALTRYAKELQKIWDDALVGAARNLQQSEAETASGEKAASTRVKASARGGGGRIARAVNGEDYWNDLSYRGYRHEVIPDSIGYAMFADDPSQAWNYGDRFAAVRHDDLPKIDDFKEAIAEAWERDKAEYLLPPALEVFEDLSGAEVADHFDPVDILDGADAWDMPELIAWAFSHGIFAEAGGIKTSDGAIAWDDSLIHDTSDDDGVWGDNLHQQSSPDTGASAAQVRYEVRESKDETVSGIKEQIRRNAKALEAMEPVGSAMVSGIERMTIAQKRQWAETILRPTGYKVDRQGFGSIYFEPRHINQGLNYLKQDGEIAAFTMLPKVLKRGIVIESRENHKGRNFGTVTIAAPVEINGIRGNMAAVVQLTGKNHYHTHRIIMPDGTAFAFNAEKNTESKPAGALLQKSTHATPIESVSKHSIRPGNEKSNTKFSVRDNTGRELTPAQQEYFRGSKARDENGNLLVMYHQTDGNFTVFDTEHKGAGTGDDETPFCVFLKKTSRDIGVRGKKQMQLYANIQNPLRVDNREQLVQSLARMSEEYASLKAESGNIDKEYGAKFEKAKRAFVDFLTRWRKENPDAPARAAYNAEGFDAAFNAEDEVVEEWTRKKDEIAVLAKKAITNALRANGYDGVFLENDKGSWGRSTEAYIALDANQVKNVDNQNPTTDPDIRFSVRERFPDELDRWEKDGMPESVEFTLGSTGPVLRGLGAIESDIYMSGDKIRTILDPDAQHPHPEMTAAEIKKIPQILEDPVLVLKSRGRGMRGENSRLAVFGLIKAKNGQPVMAVMDLRPREDGFLVDDMQKVNSAYTKDNAADFIRGSDVLFADKKRTIPLLRMTGLTIASQQLLRNGYVGSIAYSGQRVKIEGVPFSSVVQEGDTRFSVREAKITDRELLANALETTARNDLERGLLAQYQEKAKSAAQWERWLDYHRQKLADHESGAHPLTTQQVLMAREKAAQYAEKLDQLDEKLLKIESMGPMRKLLERERHRRTRVVGTFPDSNSAGTCKQFCA